MSSDLISSFDRGRTIAGKYRVERRLGVGGMGVVLEATHLLLSERVAIKVLLPHAIDDEDCRARFHREAQAAARINSPHVAKVRDMGELESSEPYIVMEYLEGNNLDALLETEGAMEIERAARLMLQACEGLASAHAAGVIHRDIKASNLFVTTAPDGSVLLKILDFGISKLLRFDTSQEASLTATQMSMGSPLSMSPEQMRSARDVDHRTDIWSLGTVLYRCFSGKQPFEADTLPQLCGLVLEANLRPLESRVQGLPLGAYEVVARCLRREPEDRYPDVAELALALAPLAGEAGAAAAERCRRILEKRSSLPAASDDARSAPAKGSRVGEPSAPDSPLSAGTTARSGGGAAVSRSHDGGDTVLQGHGGGAAVLQGEDGPGFRERALPTDTSFGRTARRTLPPIGRRSLASLALVLVLLVVVAVVFALRSPTRPSVVASAESRPRDSAVSVTAQAPRTPSVPQGAAALKSDDGPSVGQAEARATAAPAPSAAQPATRVPKKSAVRAKGRSAVPTATVDPFALRK